MWYEVMVAAIAAWVAYHCLLVRWLKKSFEPIHRYDSLDGEAGREIRAVLPFWAYRRNTGYRPAGFWRRVWLRLRYVWIRRRAERAWRKQRQEDEHK